MSATLLQSRSLLPQPAGLLHWIFPVLRGNLKSSASTRPMDHLFSSSSSSSFSSSESKSSSEACSKSSSASSYACSDDELPTNFVPDESEMQIVFKRLDDNNDGLICARDLHRFMGRLGIEMSEEDAKSMLQSVDENADGCVDFKEFYSLYLSLGKDLGEPDEIDTALGRAEDATDDDDDDTLLQVFKVFDRNNDNFITPEELQAVLIKLRIPEAMNIRNCEKMIQRVDSNGDKKIDIAEFKAMMCSNSFQNLC